MSLCIKVENLTKYFQNHLVIKDLNISIEEREIVVFQGPSGIGKSTFLRCLTYLEPFDAGVISVGDLKLYANMDVRKEKETIKRIRRQLGFVFQFFNLFPHLTVLENLTIAPIKVLKEKPESAKRRALHLLERVGLKDKAQAYPGSLSGGQTQRITIARAFAMKPHAMLFDEPTSSLDPDMKEEIVRVIEEFSKDKLTMLIVTHEPTVISQIATRIVKFGPQCTVLSDEKMLNPF